jgi:hypothetical protein
MFYFKDNSGLTVYFANGDVTKWTSDNPKHDLVYDFCKASKWTQIEALQNETKTILTEKVKVDKDGLATIDAGGTVIKLNNSRLTKMIKLLKTKGILIDDIDAVKPFLINMLENPYIDATHEIYEYCLNMDFEITPDGCFLAYKNVRPDLGSIHDGGKTKHRIGEVTKVDFFDTDRNAHCSAGLHFCSKGYLPEYPSGTTIVVKVNPKHVCSIPTDYSFQKGRCIQYVTVGIISKEGSLQTINTEEAFNEKVIKTPEKAKADKKLAKYKGHSRIEETAHYMYYYNNPDKVAKIMGISVSTVQRNMRKHRKS